MSTKTTIDLSKVKIGQRLKRRDGKIITFNGESHVNLARPFSAGGTDYSRCGKYWDAGFPDYHADIIAILPSPKAKKVAGNKAVREAIATLKQAIKKLEGLV